jgi:hypothetical protein
LVEVFRRVPEVKREGGEELALVAAVLPADQETEVLGVALAADQEAEVLGVVV